MSYICSNYVIRWQSIAVCSRPLLSIHIVEDQDCLSTSCCPCASPALHKTVQEVPGYSVDIELRHLLQEPWRGAMLLSSCGSLQRPTGRRSGTIALALSLLKRLVLSSQMLQVSIAPVQPAILVMTCVPKVDILTL